VLPLVLAASLGACATLERPDPLEPINRKVYAFNDAVDVAVLKPVATVYRDKVPAPVREAAGNFFANIKDAWSAVNLMLQGRPADSLSDLMRFGTNTVFGVLGLFDVATGLGLERHDEDLGQTLGRWGMGPGAYIVWPILGPSSVRDSLGLPIEMQVTPETWVQSTALSNSLTLTRIVNTRANLLQATRVLDEIALDKYSFVRDAYLQRRRNLVYDGNPPDVEEPRYDEPEQEMPPEPAPASPAASAAAPK
jgi:phospholipid-binding lipoprotein MlaA